VSFLQVTMARRSAAAAPLLDAAGESRASDTSGEPDAAAGDTAPPSQPPSPSSSGGDGIGLPDAIKLGLGDFIFYSLLVGRASMYDLLAAAAAALAVVAGLGATLLLLALRRHALPALPISIALGAAFTAAARCVEPVLVPLAASLVYY
jgi:presenilin 1